MNDKDVLDQIEKLVNMFISEFHRAPKDPNGTRNEVSASFYLGAISGVIMKRNL